MTNENLLLLNEIKATIRDENDKTTSRLEIRIRELEMKVVEFREHSNTLVALKEELNHRTVATQKALDKQHAEIKMVTEKQDEDIKLLSSFKSHLIGAWSVVVLIGGALAAVLL